MGPAGTSKGDVDYIGIDPRIKVADKIWLNPLAMYAYSDDAQNWAATTANQDIKVYFVGVNAGLDFDVYSLWLTAIYEGGKTLSDLCEDGVAMMISCIRCGRLLVRERIFGTTGKRSTERVDSERCLNCGAVEDDIIRANRQPAGIPLRMREPRGPRIQQKDLPALHAQLN